MGLFSSLDKAAAEQNREDQNIDLDAIGAKFSGAFKEVATAIAKIPVIPEPPKVDTSSASIGYSNLTNSSYSTNSSSVSSDQNYSSNNNQNQNQNKSSNNNMYLYLVLGGLALYLLMDND